MYIEIKNTVICDNDNKPYIFVLSRRDQIGQQSIEFGYFFKTILLYIFRFLRSSRYDRWMHRFVWIMV